MREGLITVWVVLHPLMSRNWWMTGSLEDFDQYFAGERGAWQVHERGGICAEAAPGLENRP